MAQGKECEACVKPAKIKLPSISAVKKALYADWALRVKRRDGWKCLLCGCEENLTAHHWFVCDHFAHAARYCVENGATLCYACHIRSVHTRADFVTITELESAVWRSRRSAGDAHAKAVAYERMRKFAETEVTIPLLRTMWNIMRAHPVSLREFDAVVTVKGSKLFLCVEGERQIAVVGNTVMAPGFGFCEVLVVAPTLSGYRYTIRKI